MVFVIFAMALLTLNQVHTTTNITKLQQGACAELSLKECAYALYGALSPEERADVIQKIDRLERRLGRQIKNVRDLKRQVRKAQRPRSTHGHGPRGGSGTEGGGSPNGTVDPGQPSPAPSPQEGPGSPSAPPGGPTTTPTQPSSPSTPTEPDVPSIDLPPIELPPVDPAPLPLPQVQIPSLPTLPSIPDSGEGVIICLLC